MPRLADTLSWTEQGTGLVRTALAPLTEAAFDAPTALPGWNRRHLAAHLAANACAIGNLAHWAATGERTPMYASPQQREADISAGSTLSGDELRRRFDGSAAALAAAMHRLHPQAWAADVMTAQGRTVPASQAPWLRAREVMVHAVDLATGVRFRDLPADFLQALGDDVAARRGDGRGPALLLAPTDSAARWTVAGSGPQTTVTGSLADVVAYLTGRRSAATSSAGPVPALPPWL